MQTTLNKIRSHGPCASGWKKLLAHLGKTEADNEPLSILTIIESNGLDDALWCLRAVDGSDKEIRLFAVWCARQVQHLMTDKRSIDALDVAEKYASGMATRDELERAESAAESAAWSAAWSAARSAAESAAWSAAWSAAESAARSAARSAAWSAAESAARSAAWSAAWSAAESAQKTELIRICKEIECASNKS